MNTQTDPADMLVLARVRRNLETFWADNRNTMSVGRMAEHAGVLAVNCDELIEMVERLTGAEQAGQS